jgi:hypothetical protein
MDERDRTEDASDRRGFLTLLGALGVTGLAGCGGDGDGTPTDADGNGTGDGTDTAGTTTPGDTTAPSDTTTQPPTSSPEETETPTPTMTPREPEFVPLFDADSIEASDWHKVHGGSSFEVRDGTLVGISSSSGDNGFVTTYKLFDDFELKSEVWVDPEGLNSAIQVHSHTRQGKQHPYGPHPEVELSGDAAQMQPGGQAGYIYGEKLGTGWMREDGGDAPTHDVWNNDEWNDYRILAEGSRLQTFINGEQIEDLDLEEFSDVDGLMQMGGIALQVHSIDVDGREVKWRNMEIKELDVAEWDRPFNGRNTEGWTNPLGRGDVSVSDGELQLSGDDMFFLLTEASYEDFVFDTWVNAGAKGGLLFRSPDNAIGGYRAEIDPTEDALSGSLYNASDGEWLKSIDGESHSQMAYDPGGWNYYRVVADGNKMRVWVNGITTAEVSDDTNSAGGIGLQHRGGDGTIRFRDLEVKTIEAGTLN